MLLLVQEESEDQPSVGVKHGHAGRVTLPGGSAGRLAPPDGGGTPSLPRVVGGFQSALERDVLKLKDRLFIRGTFSSNYAIMCHG